MSESNPRQGLSVVGGADARRELHQKRARLHAELEGLDVTGSGMAERADRLAAGVAKIDAELDQLNERERDRLRAAVAGGQLRLEHGTGFTEDHHFGVLLRHDPWSDPGQESALETRSRAAAAIERWPADDVLKESATRTLERAGAGLDSDADTVDVRGVAAHILRYSRPAYISAFRKYAKDPETYVADLTTDEARVWREAREYQRAALQTSGAVLPSPLDPTVVLTNSGAVDPMRSVARVDTTVAKSKRYITSAGSTFSFDAELAEVSDDTFTETEVSIVTHKAQGWIQASIETFMDQPDFSSEVAKIIADGKARLEATSFISGSGTNAPKGIEVALNATASEVNSAGETLTADDVYGLLEALPPRFRSNATWQAELSTFNHLARLYNPSGTEPPLLEGDRLLRRPYVENSSVDPYSAVNAAATASNRVLFVGDWREFVILDRVGLSVHFVGPGVLQNTANNLPDGRVGWYAYWRVGSDVTTASAFRMLDVQTTA